MKGGFFSANIYVPTIYHCLLTMVRVRLVKGSGEILEECVSKERQREINRQATVGDGQAFQRDIKSRLGVKARLY